MDPFLVFLQKTKDFANTIPTTSFNTPLHIVMGNEACDLDSMITALALGYLHYTRNDTQTVIPILNITSEEFALKTENRYICNKLRIDQNLLVFRSDLNLKELHAKGLLQLSLVDHHVLPFDDQSLSDCVIEIYDHRPIDQNAQWRKDRVKIVIEEVGCCASLITKEIYTAGLPLPATLALLLYNVIIFDTIALNPEAKKFKELDVKMLDKLAKQFHFKDVPKEVFDELWAAHNDVSDLTPKQLLYKDLKIVDKLPISVVPMTVKNYLKLPNVMKDIESFCEEKQTSALIIIGLHITGQEVQRDIAIYEHNGKSLTDVIVAYLKNAENSKGYNFCLEEVSLGLSNVTYFIQKNVRLTRKHILPVIKDALIELNKTK